MRAMTIATMTLGVVTPILLGAQASQPTLDVASIKQNRSDSPAVTQDIAGNRWRITNGSVTLILRAAYPPGIQFGEMPPWASTERYDVVATTVNTDRPLTRADWRPLIKQLLEDRFKLAAHLVPRDQPAYALVRARSDGQLGPQIKRIDVDCATLSKMPPAERAALPQPANGAPLCGMRDTNGTLAVGGGNLAALAGLLSAGNSATGRVVVDKTGLDGYYEFTLRYARSLDPNATSDDYPAIFTALREQLGLTLQPDRTTVDMLVIDHIEKPTEN